MKPDEMKSGDYVYGRRIASIRPYVIPACVLHDFYAQRYPDGMPGFLVDYVGGGGITLFAGEDYSAEV